jgi:transposase
MSLGPRGPRQCDMEQRGRQLHATANPLVLVDEAGPGGSGLSRYLAQKGPGGWGVAPSLMPQTAGARVNTARRDAVQLARLRRSGALTPVSAPQVADEAIRDRTRGREDPRGELKAAKVRRNAFLRRHARR